MSALPSPGWLAETLVATTLLMLLVLAVRRPVARLWGAHYAYALWALPALRMVLPAIPGWQPLYVPVAAVEPPDRSAVAVMNPVDAVQFMPLAPMVPEPGIDWPATLLSLWAVGAALFLAVQWARHARFVGRAVATGKRLVTIAGVDVFLSPHVPGPMAAGIWRRRILLPADFMARYAPDERKLALQHEAAHHDRFDLAANLAGLLVLAAHWWNPVAHAAWRAFRADQELACDATVLAGSDGETRAAYGQAILKSACVATPVAACAMNHKHQLKDRIAMMKLRNFGTTRRIAGGLSVAALAAAGLIATASGAQPALPAAPPVPPAPPAPAAAPAPPAPPKVMVFHLKRDGADKGDKDEKGAKGEKGETPAKGDRREVRVMVMDGHGGAHGALPMLHDLPPLEGKDGVQVSETPDGRKMVMVRRVMGGHGAGDPAEMRKLADARMTEVKAEMRARCEKEGTPVAADADLALLATCGRDIQKEIREAMATARKAINDAKWLSAAERDRALKGLDQAQADIRRDVIVRLDK